jgi:hypothetical protein
MVDIINGQIICEHNNPSACTENGYEMGAMFMPFLI